MTPKNLFIIILKTLGIFFIKDIIEAVPQLISSLFYLSKSESLGAALFSLFFTLIIIGVYILVSYYLIFKANKIIDTLQLDQGFDQESLTLNISTTTILAIAIIITGAFILTTEIPNLCRYLFLYLQEKRLTYGQTKPDITRSIFSLVKIIIGLLLIGERKRIVAFITKRHSEEIKDDIE